MSAKPLNVLPVVEPVANILPDIATTKLGCQFAPHEDIWVLREMTYQVTLRFDEMTYLETHFKVAFKAVLVWYAQNHSLGNLKSLFNDCRNFFRYKARISSTPIVELSSVDILNYKAHLGTEQEANLVRVKIAIKKWHGLGYAGVTKDAVALVKQLRIKSRPTGVAVATLDPIRGPFTALEQEALQHALTGAFAREEVSLADYVLCWLFMALGMRPTQYARLKVCDVMQMQEKDGTATYLVRMPRAKQGSSDEREQLKERILTPQLGELVFKYARQIEQQHEGIFADPAQTPLFIAREKPHGADANTCHLRANTLANRLNSVMDRLNVFSERTGEALKIHPKRFRQTIGTRAAEEGHGEFVIAELLDHSNTQSVGVYVRSTPAIVERIDRAIAMQLAPLAQAFAGKQISSVPEAPRHNEMGRVIRAPAIVGTFDAISSCGKHGFCGFLKPIACYTCTNFEPWLDGPHEQVLTHLLTERERLIAAGDARIATINDRAILAVAQVIQLCEAVHAGMDASHD
jgi:integrase